MTQHRRYIILMLIIMVIAATLYFMRMRAIPFYNTACQQYEQYRATKNANIYRSMKKDPMELKLKQACDDEIATYVDQENKDSFEQTQFRQAAL